MKHRIFFMNLEYQVFLIGTCLAKTLSVKLQLSVCFPKKRVQSLAGFQPVCYSCCINSYVCFVGPYEDLIDCPNCKQAQFKANGKPHKCFDYILVIPWLQAMLANSIHAKEMCYQANHIHEPGVIKDAFDGSHYWSLLNTIVSGHEDNPFFYFSDECDITLGLLIYSFALFKRHNKTCWPIILFNYNLPPEIHFQKKYCIHAASPGAQETLGLGLILLATCSRTDPTRAGYQGFQCNQPGVIFTSCLSHPGIWQHSGYGSDHVHEGAKWYQSLSNMQHQRCSLWSSHELYPLAMRQDFWSYTSLIHIF